MSIPVLFSARDALWETYHAALPAACARAGLDIALTRDPAATNARYIVYAPNDALRDFTPFTQAKAVLSLWAGVETIVSNPTLTQPLARMVDPGLREGMRDYVVGHVMRAHLGMDAHIVNPTHAWIASAPPLARDRRVSVLGLGNLGETCAVALAMLGFDVAGWSRRPKQIEGITCLSGDAGLRAALARADILVTLLPATPETDNLLNAETLACLPQGASIINPGRGTLIDDDALLAALDTGQVAQATLDVFRTEPLPSDDRFWAHPRVTVTPHIASETRADTASDAIADNIRRGEAGLPFRHLVDRSAGY